jgi:hypothetical protein
MKRRSFVTTLATLAMLAMTSAVQAAAPSTAFTGTWMGQDPMVVDGGDGSWNHLVVKGGSHARIDFQDEFGSVCWDAGATDFWFSSSLSGSVSGNTMTGSFRSAKCGHLSLSWMRGTTHTWVLDQHGTSDPADDTLWDGYVSWFRV